MVWLDAAVAVIFCALAGWALVMLWTLGVWIRSRHRMPWPGWSCSCGKYPNRRTPAVRDAFGTVHRTQKCSPEREEIN